MSCLSLLISSCSRYLWRSRSWLLTSTTTGQWLWSVLGLGKNQTAWLQLEWSWICSCTVGTRLRAACLWTAPLDSPHPIARTRSSWLIWTACAGSVWKGERSELSRHHLLPNILSNNFLFCRLLQYVWKSPVQTSYSTQNGCFSHHGWGESEIKWNKRFFLNNKFNNIF